MNEVRRLRPAIIGISAALLLLLVAIGGRSEMRSLAALWFVGVCPGLAFTGFLRMPDPWMELSVSLALSLALDILVAAVVAYWFGWSPDLALGILVGLSLAAVSVRPLWSAGAHQARPRRTPGARPTAGARRAPGGAPNAAAMPPLSTRIVAMAAAALTLVGLASLAGHWAARQGSPERSRAQGGSRSATLGPLRITVPHDWHRVPVSEAGIAGIDSASTLVYDLAAGLSPKAVLTLAPLSGTQHPSLIPRPLRDAAQQPPGRPLDVRLAGRRAWTYGEIPVGRRDQTMTVTVLPTTSGVLAIACIGARFVLLGAVDCASAVGLDLTRTMVITPSRDLAFRLRSQQTMRGLDRVRVAQRKTLRQAGTPRGRAHAASRLAGAYASAARVLATVAGGPGAADVVVALRDSSGAYRRLGRAALARDRAAFVSAARAIDSADSRLARALSKIGRRDERSSP